MRSEVFFQGKRAAAHVWRIVHNSHFLVFAHSLFKEIRLSLKRDVFHEVEGILGIVVLKYRTRTAVDFMVMFGKESAQKWRNAPLSEILPCRRQARRAVCRRRIRCNAS